MAYIQIQSSLNSTQIQSYITLQLQEYEHGKFCKNCPQKVMTNGDLHKLISVEIWVLIVYKTQLFHFIYEGIMLAYAVRINK